MTETLAFAYSYLCRRESESRGRKGVKTKLLKENINFGCVDTLDLVKACFISEKEECKTRRKT